MGRKKKKQVEELDLDALASQMTGMPIPEVEVLPPEQDDAPGLFPKLKLFNNHVAAVKEIDEDSGVVVAAESPKHAMVDATALTFDPRVAFALALGLMEPQEICKTFDVSEDMFNDLCANDEFNITVKKYKEELGTNGASFKAKALLQSDLLLETSWKLIHAAHTPAAVKADMIKWTAKVAGLEPQKEKDQSGMNFQLNIQM